MSRITRNDFQEWKMHKCTVSMMDKLQENARNLELKLASSAGQDQLMDRFYSGYWMALQDLMGVQLAEEEATTDASDSTEAADGAGN